MTQPLPPTDTTTPPEPVVVEELTPVEAAFYALVLAALAAWLTAVAAKVLNPFRLYGMAPVPDAIWSMAPAWAVEVKRLVAWLKDNAAPVGWTRWFDSVPGVNLDYPSTNAHIAAHLALVENYLVRIPEEVFNLVIADVIDGHNAGESFEDIAARIENTLSVTRSENWPNRARVIAVTETNGVSNAGWYAAGLRTEELLGTVQWKQWLQSHDEAVRSEHRTDQKRPLRQPFMIGGYPMNVPGDKMAPVHLVANCRCTAGSTEAPR